MLLIYPSISNLRHTKTAIKLAFVCLFVGWEEKGGKGKGERQIKEMVKSFRDYEDYQFLNWNS